MASTGEAAVRRHGACLAAVGTALALAIQFSSHYVYFDRAVAEHAGKLLLSGHLDVYALAPKAQMGPLALALAGGLPYWVYVVVVCGLLYPLLYVGMLAWRPSPGLAHIAGAGLVGAAWHRIPITAHGDDALVLVGAVLIALAKKRDLPWLAAAGFVLAIAGKPTAVLLLPLVWLVSSRAAVWSVVGMAVVWLPFALADVHGFLHAGGGIAPVFPYSLPDLLGSAPMDPYPWWVRPVQLVGGLALCWLVARRGDFAAALLATLAFRTLLEPGTYPLYWQSVIVAAFFFDLGRRVPWATSVALVGWMMTLFSVLTLTQGVGRLLLLAGLAVAASVVGLRRLEPLRGEGAGQELDASRGEVRRDHLVPVVHIPRPGAGEAARDGSATAAVVDPPRSGGHQPESVSTRA